MGTGGYIIYRYKSRYYVHFNQLDSYPSVFGLEVRNKIPSGTSFETWVERMRESLVEEYNQWVENGRQNSYEYFIADKQPSNDLMIEWIYEIDLDRLVFHIDSFPVFRLDNMPPEDVFLECIRFDHYGGRAYARDTPEEFRYNLKTPPLPVDEAVVKTYSIHAGVGAVVLIHDLLEIVERMSGLEAVWERYLEVCVGQMMKRYGRELRDMESRASRAELTEMDMALALSAINMAFPAPLDQDPPFSLPVRTDDLWWVREDACVLVTTHVDDEPSLQSSIVVLREAVMKKADSPDTVYGIITSSFHIAIVRVDKISGGSLKHTPALQFIPSFYALSPSTPGITALARLARRTRPFTRPQLPPLPSTSSLSRLPHQILGEFAKHITSAHDLKNFAMASSPTFLAAEPYLELPRVGNRFLISPETFHFSEHEVREGGRAHPNLISGTFDVLTEEGAEVMTVTAGAGGWYGDEDFTPLNTFNPVKMSFGPLAE